MTWICLQIEQTSLRQVFLRRIQVCLRYCRTLCLSNVCIYSPSETAGMNKIHNLKHISLVVKQKVV